MMTVEAQTFRNTDLPVDKRETLEQVNTKGESVLPKGEYKIYIGTSSPSVRTTELGGIVALELEINVK